VTACTTGKYSEVVGAYNSGVCIDCAAGTYHDEGTGGISSAVCTKCAAGKFSSISGATDESACIGCAAGTASAAVGADDLSACSQCPASTYSDGSDAHCTPCPLGSTSPVGSTGEDACHFSMSFTYMLTKVEYQHAADELKMTTAPFKTAKDAMTTGACEFARENFCFS
jgi:hypothetical protein